TAEEESGDPFLIAMADRAKQVQENYEDRQTTTQEAMNELFADIKRNEERKKEQAEKGYDSLRYFVFTTLQETGVKDAEAVSAKVAKAFVEHPNWRQSEAELRELRKAVTFAVYAQVDDLDDVAARRLTFDESLLRMPSDVQDYVIVHELLHLQVPNHGKLWKSLMRAHLGAYELLESRLKRFAG